MPRDKKVQKYIRAVSACLKCPAKIKKKIMRTILADIESAIQKGIITAETISDVFGAPELLADDTLNSFEPDELKKEIRNGKVKFILITCITVIVLLGAVYMWFYTFIQYYHGEPVVNGVVVNTTSST